jgi:hypothetical protein
MSRSFWIKLNQSRAEVVFGTSVFIKPIVLNITNSELNHLLNPKAATSAAIPPSLYNKFWDVLEDSSVFF